MAIDYDPFCPVCAGLFSHVELLDFPKLGEDDRYRKDAAYDSQVLSSAQADVS